MSGKQLTLALTPGDPLGVGPEIVVRALHAFRGVGARFRLYGPDCAWDDVLPTGSRWQRVAAPAPSDPRPSRRGASAWGGRIAMESVEAAVRDALAGQADAVVTAPVSKQSMQLAGWLYTGQTELLADLTRAPEWAMMLAHGCHRVILATRHLPLRDVPGHVTREGLVRLMLLADRELQVFLGRRPRILVCGLNPHAGDAGLLGDEEVRIIAPAVADVVRRGCDVHGPVSAEEAFLHWGHGADIVIAMYHDQGALPVKLLGLEHAVNVTLGLPIVRTSPGHGTAYSLAGTGTASERSMLAAMQWAVALARRRSLWSGS